MKRLIKVSKAPREVEMQDVEYPKPKPGWVTMAVKACGICGSDVHMYLGEWLGPESSTFGHEFAGKVVEVGQDVNELAEGDRVVCMPKMNCGKCYYCRTGRPHLCPNEPLLNGAIAEYISAPAYTLFKLPEEITYEEASLMEPFAVALSAVYETAQPYAGQTAVIVGPGPIGLLTLAACKLNAPTITVVAGTQSDSYRLQLAEKLGADVVVNVNEENLAKRVKELTEGMGADVLYECAGAGLIDEAVDLLKYEGKLVAIGHPPANMQIKFTAKGYLNAQFKQLKILGHIIYSWKAFHLALKLLQHRKVNLKQLITHRVPLSNAVEGFEFSIKKEAVKVLIIP